MDIEEAISKCREIMRRETTEDCEAEAISTVLKALAKLNDRKELKMEIEVGEYIRDKNGIIARVNKIGSIIIEVMINTGEAKVYLEEEIIKHSKNIIDLIELGDFVNGLEVLKTEYYDKDGNYIEELGVEEFESIVPLREYFDENYKIKEILTYEQYEKNVFSLEGE